MCSTSARFGSTREVQATLNAAAVTDRTTADEGGVGAMGILYDYCTQIQNHIEHNGMDLFRVRGELALRVGFLISLIDPDDPDDPEKVRALREAADDVLGLTLL